jgi:hypothetical protein
MRALRLEKGSWFVGLTRPFMASQAMVEKGLRLALPPEVAAKFGPFVWHKRAEEYPPINPQRDPLYRDDWDEWVGSSYSGEPLEVQVPDLISWVVSQTGAAQQPAAPAPSSPSSPSSPGQYPPTWSQPGSVPVPPLPAPAPSSPAPSSTPAPSSSDFGSIAALLVLLFFFSRRRSR